MPCRPLVACALVVAWGRASYLRFPFDQSCRGLQVLHCYLGMVLHATGKSSEALDMLQRASLMEPRNPQVTRQRCRCWCEMNQDGGEYVEGRDGGIQHPLMRFYHDIQARFQRANVLMKLERLEEALAELEKVAKQIQIERCSGQCCSLPLFFCPHRSLTASPSVIVGAGLRPAGGLGALPHGQGTCNVVQRKAGQGRTQSIKEGRAAAANTMRAFVLEEKG